MIITEEAKSFITQVMEENGVHTLRFAFEGAGCCGPNYSLTLAKGEENDITEIVNGIEVAMDPKVVEVVRTLTQLKGEGKMIGIYTFS
ncbi:adhesin [Bacillus sp. FSL W8-0223]|uniref:adhesin n=1 Tax=Bacillus sp. FSL W8-0223 TaxID=2954595 RepID=UPI0030FAA6DA